MNWQTTFPPIPMHLVPPRIRKTLPPDSWMSYCPFHSDRSGMLFVMVSGDKVGLRCSHGCTRDDLLHAGGIVTEIGPTVPQDAYKAEQQRKREWHAEKRAIGVRT